MTKKIELEKFIEVGRWLAEATPEELELLEKFTHANFKFKITIEKPCEGCEQYWSAPHYCMGKNPSASWPASTVMAIYGAAPVNFENVPTGYKIVIPKAADTMEFRLLTVSLIKDCCSLGLRDALDIVKNRLPFTIEENCDSKTVRDIDEKCKYYGVPVEITPLFGNKR